MNKLTRIVSSLLIMALLISACALALSSCGGGANPPEDSVTRVTVDVNPSVEFMVDDENKIVSVTALNDDGSVLIAGEAFVGKTPEEGVEIFLSLAKDTGYLTEGTVSADANEVKLSVSGDSAYADKLKSDLKSAAEEKLTALNVQGKIAELEALGREALVAMAASGTHLTDEELEQMSDEDIYKALCQARIETAELLTVEMREAYFAAKEHKIAFAEREETAKVIQQMGGIYTLIHTTYKAALESYSAAIAQVEQLRYSTLIDPESDYQKALTSLRESKAALLEQRTYVATLEVNGEDYASAQVTLQAKEENYQAALDILEALGTAADAAISQLITAMKTAETALITIEQSFSDDITAELTAKAQQMEDGVNAAKDAFFEEFEAKHAEHITAMQAELAARKQALLATDGQ